MPRAAPESPMSWEHTRLYQQSPWSLQRLEVQTEAPNMLGVPGLGKDVVLFLPAMDLSRQWDNDIISAFKNYGCLVNWIN